ncbi:MAG: Fe-S-containing protein [Acidobacteriota bacterium]|jgi:uncharacterized membrane protein
MRGVLLVTVLILASACGPELPEHLEVLAEGDAVRIPTASVDDGAVHFFAYSAERTRVHFLVRTDGTGRLQTHLDACFSCYRYRMGFVVEDRFLVCRACRLKYAVEDRVWEYIGACAPISLPSTVVGEDLVIERRALEKAARYF